MIILTITCPAAHIASANHLAMALGGGPDDANTYRTPSWQDVDVNLHAAASHPVSKEYLESLRAPLVRPEWDVDETIDMTAATAAQAMLVFWQYSEENPTPPLATPDTITAIAGPDGLDALAMMGLTRVAEDQP